MHMLLYLKRFIVCFQIHTDGHIKSFVGFSKRFVIGILHISARILIPLCQIDILVDKIGIQIFSDKIFALQIYDGSFLSFFIDQNNSGNPCLTSYIGIIGTKIWCDMHNTCSVFGRYIVTGNNAKCAILHWRNEGK